MKTEQEADRLVGMLALVGDKTPAPEGEAPSEEMLAAFIDGRLSKKDRAHVISFLARDPESYERWMSAVDAQQQFAMDDAKAIATMSQVATGGQDTPTEGFFARWFGGYGWSGGAAAFCMLGISAVILPSLFTEPGLNEFYQRYPMISI